MRNTACTTLFTLAVLAAPSPTRADNKPFAFTYPAETAREEHVEIEHSLDIELQDWDDPATPEDDDGWAHPSWEHQLEVEYGITEAWDFGFYNVFEQPPFGPLEYDGLMLRTRYNFAAGRDWIVEPGVYLEVGYLGDAVMWEEMLILAARAGVFETSLNLKAEQELEYGGDETALEHEAIVSYAAGFHLGAQAALSLEYYGKAKIAAGALDYFVSYLGPTLHLAGSRFYWNIAVQPQLGSNKELAAVRVRSLFALAF